MRLWILSDLHAELTRGWDLPGPVERPDYDVMIIAGDLIPRMERGVKWLIERVPEKPCIYVAGNHEFYGTDLDKTIEKAKEAAMGSHISVVQNETVQLGNVVFAGATLWTDFNLFGDQRRAFGVAADRMNDFKKIRMNAYLDRFRPKYALHRHLASRAFLEREMRKARSGKLVIVTHHAPFFSGALLSNTPTEDEILTAAYRSDLTALMSPARDDGRGALRPADLWVYGHTHESFDALIGATRVVSNSKGYGPWLPSRQQTWDNPNFNPHFVVEI
ncbi:metallophosphoesterase [Bradyrhizobium lablabi]|uniref:metallophosphoesterase n=1 Tax=Bradyrhizobium lablabi TaxID=722472 RepID=UPI001BA6C435|nr:metallophosphoesterase [Bradyrhizobium lablabi]MBR0695336.1 metallophosphoesterase [Bradyrhizobium lablabi]